MNRLLPHLVVLCFFGFQFNEAQATKWLNFFDCEEDHNAAVVCKKCKPDGKATFLVNYEKQFVLGRLEGDRYTNTWRDFGSCKVVDAQNWVCEEEWASSPEFKSTIDSRVMTNGQLYWSNYIRSIEKSYYSCAK